MNIFDAYKKLLVKKETSFDAILVSAQDILNSNDVRDQSGKKVTHPKAFVLELLTDLHKRDKLSVSKDEVWNLINLLPPDMKGKVASDDKAYWKPSEQKPAEKKVASTAGNLTYEMLDAIEEVPAQKSRVIVLNSDNHVLLGLSKDTREYALPGGHIEENESFRVGAIRELKEETGIDLKEKDLVYLFDAEGERVFLVLNFDLRFGPTPSQDPDKEYVLLQWFPVEKLPPNIRDCCQEIICRYLRGKDKEDMPQMVWASTTWKDYVNGEYWIVGRDYTQADSDVDVGHEVVAMESMLGHHSDTLIELLNEKGIKYEGKEIEEDNLLEAYTFGAIPADIGKEAMGPEWEAMEKDVRAAYMEFYGAIMNINMSFAAWKITAKTIDDIQTFILEQAQGDVPNSENLNDEVVVEEYSTNRHKKLHINSFLEIKGPGQLWRAVAKTTARTIIFAEQEFPGVTQSKVGNKLYSQMKDTDGIQDFKGIINTATKSATIQSLKPKSLGAAKELLTWFEKKAKSLGIQRITSEIFPNTSDLWASLGYKVIKRENFPPIVKKLLGPGEAHAEEESANEKGEGVIEVLVDGKVAFRMDDSVVWEVLPRIAQERAKGKKIEYKQVLPSGEVINFDLDTKPIPDAPKNSDTIAPVN